tara:strand:+ start:1407 stop:1664 length:258 start_codon:yes stop_codon:yes gene_type:complete
MKLTLRKIIVFFFLWLALLYFTHVMYYKKTMYVIAAAPFVLAFVYGLNKHKNDNKGFDDFARTQKQLYDEQQRLLAANAANNPPF